MSSKGDPTFFLNSLKQNMTAQQRHEKQGRILLIFINKGGFKTLSEEIQAVMIMQRMYLFGDTYCFVCHSASDPS